MLGRQVPPSDGDMHSPEGLLHGFAGHPAGGVPSPDALIGAPAPRPGSGASFGTEAGAPSGVSMHHHQLFLDEDARLLPAAAAYRTHSHHL
jgi:hypothetical protein